jgi:hypothetical protein
MGTRNLICVVSDDQYKVAQYCQWDGYLTGQGHTICDFIQNTLDKEKFKQALNECEFITQEELHKRSIECGATERGFTLEAWNTWKSFYPELCRDTGADILSLIQDQGKRKLYNQLNFAGNSLFCEWAYVIDLDNEILEIYKGFNQDQLNESERFKDLECPNLDYKQVKFLASFPFKEATRENLSILDIKINNENQ